MTSLIIGSMGMAFSDLFTNAEFIVNVEPATSMKRLGKYISQEFNNMVWVSSLSDTLRFDQHKTYDVVSISNVLEEMPTPESSLMLSSQISRYSRLMD